MAPLRQRSPRASACNDLGTSFDNRPGWRSPESLKEFANTQAWLDAGERAAVFFAASEARGQPVLDIGIGGGRTTGLLRLISQDYVGVDYTPEMVELCRAAFPSADIRLGDARDLTGLPSDHFALVTFSFNGIDSVDRDGRVRALAEMCRVTRPGGLVVFSTLNKDGPSSRLRPWHIVAIRTGPHPLALALLSLPIRIGRHVRSIRNWRRLRRDSEDHGGWAIAPIPAFGFSMLVHYTTLSQAIDDAAAAGLVLETAIAHDATALTSASDTSDIHWFQLVFRRSA
jgi:SAM-dependent methyltransferase